jgi:peptidoglycan/xylan/chitin deacetylase (PgdA/CDA1 family)
MRTPSRSSRERTRRALWGGLLCLPLSLLPAVVPAAPTSAAVRPCSAGLVALTFDDGPAAGTTGNLLGILEDHKVPATFFMVGERVDATPALARRVSKAGFAVGDHSYRHENLTGLGDAAIRATLRHTRRSLRAAGVRLTGLMRPPYGAINSRVRAVVAGMGLTPVLWTDDSRDWAGGSTDAIARSVLAQLRPHYPNVVLQHDGVGNSPASVAAVPRIVRTARSRGYCFAGLGRDGRPTPPVPRATVADTQVTERDGQPADLVFRLGLDRPTSRDTSVLVATADGTATAADYRGRSFRLRVPPGVTSAVVRVPVVGDLVDEPDETLRLRLTRPRGLVLSGGAAVGHIVDDDPEPSLSVGDATVGEPTTGTATASVLISLDHRSGRPVSVHVVTVAGSATEGDYTPVDTTAVIAPGRRSVTVAVPVLADDVDEPDEQLSVQLDGAQHASIADATGTVTIQPPPPATAP